MSARDRAGRAALLLARLGFAMLVVALPVRANRMLLPQPASIPSGVAHDLPVFAIDILAVTILVLWVGGRLLLPRPVETGPRALALAVGVLLVMGWLTVPTGIVPGVSALSALRLTAGAALALYVYNEVDGLASLAVPLGAMLLLHALVAIGQAAVQGSVGLGLLAEPRLDPAAPGTSVVTLADGSRLLRAYGLANHPNILGGILGCGSLLLLGTRPTSRRARLATRGILVVAGVAILLTFSRGALLGTAAGLGVGALLLGGPRLGGPRLGGPRLGGDLRWWLSAAGTAVLAAALVALPLRDALIARTTIGPGAAASEQRSVDERAAQIGLGIRVAIAHPVTGVGLGAVSLAMKRAEPGFPFAFQPPHVVLLVAFAELGIAGGVAEAAIMLVPWFLLARRRRRPVGLELAAASAALLALTVASLFDYYPWYGGQGRILSWIVLGLWAMAWRRSEAARG